MSDRYRSLQVEVHPDRFANASEEEKLSAVTMSSYLNEAFETLKLPLKRAAYLLKLRDLDVEQVSQQDLGMELLIEQMQLRESLDELPNDQSALPALESLKSEVLTKLESKLKSFANHLGQDELDIAKSTFHELQFLQKLLSEIEIGEEQRLGY